MGVQYYSAIEATVKNEAHLNAKEIHEIMLWSETRGYFEKNDLSEFMAYDKAALSELAVSGAKGDGEIKL